MPSFFFHVYEIRWGGDVGGGGGGRMTTAMMVEKENITLGLELRKRFLKSKLFFCQLKKVKKKLSFIFK